MKGFKHTGNGPVKGFHFAVGGLVDNKPVEAPGFQDFKKGGKAVFPFKAKRVMTKSEAKEKERLKNLSNAGKLLRKARGGPVCSPDYPDVPGAKKPMSANEAMTHAKGGLAFLRKPKIGK